MELFFGGELSLFCAPEPALVTQAEECVFPAHPLYKQQASWGCLSPRCPWLVWLLPPILSYHIPSTTRI